MCTLLPARHSKVSKSSTCPAPLYMVPMESTRNFDDLLGSYATHPPGSSTATPFSNPPSPSTESLVKERLSASVSTPFAAFFSPRPSLSHSSTSQASLPSDIRHLPARQTLDVQFDRTPLSATLSDLLVDRLGEIYSPFSEQEVSSRHSTD